MQLIKRVLLNASIISLIHELHKKYPQPVVVYDNSADGMQGGNISIYQILITINSQWVSKSLIYENTSGLYLNEFNSLHVFCVDKLLDSANLIRDNILRSSNTFIIQNIILFNENELENDVEIDLFARNERINRNTLLCERHIQLTTCWHWTQRIDRVNLTLTDLIYEPIDLNLLAIQIMAQHSPPNAFAMCISDRFLFGGLDGMVTAEIVSKFNASPSYCNKQVVRQMKGGYCKKGDKMNEKDALQVLRQLKVGRKSKHIFYHTIFDSRMIKYLFFERADCKGAPDVIMNTGPMNIKDNMKKLLPTDFSCISIIVPRAHAASSFLQRTLYNSVESISFLCAVILFTIARILISKSPLAQWLDIFYSTFVVFLTQTTLRPKTIPERILCGVLLFVSVAISVMLSGLIFTSMVNNPSSKSIQTLNDLAASKYTIFALDNAGNWMDNLRDDIRVKMVLVNYTVITRQLVTLNTTVAYAINENLFGLLRATWGSSNLDQRLFDVYYEMDEKLHCGYFAYRIANSTALENDINQILQHMVEHGFIGAFKKWTFHLMKLANVFEILSVEKRPPINLRSNPGIYYIYFCGILFSCIVFLCEVLRKACSSAM